MTRLKNIISVLSYVLAYLEPRTLRRCDQSPPLPASFTNMAGTKMILPLLIQLHNAYTWVQRSIRSDLQLTASSDKLQPLKSRLQRLGFLHHSLSTRNYFHRLIFCYMIGYGQEKRLKFFSLPYRKESGCRGRARGLWPKSDEPCKLDQVIGYTTSPKIVPRQAVRSAIQVLRLCRCVYGSDT
jgi:hypothetical protein